VLGGDLGLDGMDPALVEIRFEAAGYLWACRGLLAPHLARVSGIVITLRAIILPVQRLEIR
jgi:hypothetical protein